MEGQNATLHSTRVAPNGISPLTSARNRPKPGNGLSAYLYQSGTIHFHIFSSKDKADVFKLMAIGQQCRMRITKSGWWMKTCEMVGAEVRRRDAGRDTKKPNERRRQSFLVVYSPSPSVWYAPPLDLAIILELSSALALFILSLTFSLCNPGLVEPWC